MKRHNVLRIHVKSFSGLFLHLPFMLLVHCRCFSKATPPRGRKIQDPEVPGFLILSYQLETTQEFLFVCCQIWRSENFYFSPL